MKTVYAVSTKEKDHWVFHDSQLSQYVESIESVYACWTTSLGTMWCEHLYSYPMFNLAFERLPQNEQNDVWEDATMALANMDNNLSHAETADTVMRAVQRQKAPVRETNDIEAVLEQWLTDRPI